jgi:hypothetical protein
MKSTLPLVLAAAVVFAGCEAAPTASVTARTPAAAGPSFTGTGSCAPRGSVIISPSPSPYYDWIGNGGPASGDCWSLFNASFVTGTTDCGWVSNAIEFAYAGSMNQEFTLPSTSTQTNFDLAYLLDFIDPNNDGAWNRFSITVTDQTTGVMLTHDEYYGNSNGGADLSCSRRDKVWTGNLAGHTLTVHVSGSKAYPDTHIRIRSISLFQY